MITNLNSLRAFKEMVEKRAERARSTDVYAELMELMRELHFEEQFIEEIEAQVMPDDMEDFH